MTRASTGMAMAMATSVACAITAAPASATPFVDIRALWDLEVFGPPPAGVEITCTGNAIRSNSGCGDQVSLHTTVTSTQSLSVTSTGGFTIVNISGGSLTGLLDFNIERSAFNPGSPYIGLSVDDPATQSASFSSGVYGYGSATAVETIYDNHSCSVGFLGESGYVFSPTTCGVPSPDSSGTEYLINLADLAAGATLDFTAWVGITADFTLLALSEVSFLPESSSLPEPSSFVLLLLSLAALGGYRIAVQGESLR